MATAVTTSDALAARELPSAVNTPELLEEHARITQGKVRTRFPPEPNGYFRLESYVFLSSVMLISELDCF